MKRRMLTEGIVHSDPQLMLSLFHICNHCRKRSEGVVMADNRLPIKRNVSRMAYPLKFQPQVSRIFNINLLPVLTPAPVRQEIRMLFPAARHGKLIFTLKSFHPELPHSVKLLHLPDMMLFK